MADLTFNDKELRKAHIWLKSLKLEGAKRRKLLEKLGTELVDQQTERVEVDKAAPDGTPWREWSQSYRKWRSKQEQNPGKGLGIAEGYLLESLGYQFQGDYAVRAGSDMEYAGYFDGEERKDKSLGRPFVGLSDANQEALLGIVDDFMEGLIRG